MKDGKKSTFSLQIGTLSFVGHTKFAPGEWIGLTLDSAEGKNDGTVQGVPYFSCPPNHGLYCKSSKLERIASSPSPSLTVTNEFSAQFKYVSFLLFRFLACMCSKFFFADWI